GFGAVPGADKPGGGVALLEVGGVPEQDEVVDDASHGRGAGDGLWRLVLGIGEAEELLLVVKCHFDGPPPSVAFQDEGVVDGEVGAEERLVAASAAGVSDDDDLDRLVAERAVPESGAAKGQRGDLPPVEGDRQRIPASAGRRHHPGGGEPVPLASWTAALSWTA